MQTEKTTADEALGQAGRGLDLRNLRERLRDLADLLAGARESV